MKNHKNNASRKKVTLLLIIPLTLSLVLLCFLGTPQRLEPSLLPADQAVTLKLDDQTHQVKYVPDPKEHKPDDSTHGPLTSNYFKYSIFVDDREYQFKTDPNHTLSTDTAYFVDINGDGNNEILIRSISYVAALPTYPQWKIHYFKDGELRAWHSVTVGELARNNLTHTLTSTYERQETAQPTIATEKRKIDF